ncbi:hypothetical protein [Draconibacterium orientale]|uniref:hypothetical protein n=1 Tax=Draconibacterium orientale TaxID=1168034 RepID=UPI0029C0F0FB|nr:hypothetical protein [Draconibacterium orientale]
MKKEKYDIKPSQIYGHVLTQLENGEYSADEERQLLAKIHSLEDIREWIEEMSDTDRQKLKLNLGATVQEFGLPFDVFVLSFIIDQLGYHGLQTERLIDVVDDSDNLYEQLNLNFYSQFFFIK